MIQEITKFIIYSILIIIISKYLLAKFLRKIAENLNLKSKTVGIISGIATSIPEFLTITISSLKGLKSTILFNILSSNIINFIQYIISIIINKNIKNTKNKAIQFDIFIVILTLIIPIIQIKIGKSLSIRIIPIFISIYILIININNKIHKIYLKKEEQQLENKIQIENQKIKKDQNNSINIIILIISGILLYLIGEFLGKTLENLSNIFNISQKLIGIFLGIITSIPEFITFFESQKYYKKSILGIVESTNNLLSSNLLNLFVIQSIAIFIQNLI